MKGWSMSHDSGCRPEARVLQSMFAVCLERAQFFSERKRVMKKLLCIVCFTLVFPFLAQAQGPIKKNEMIDLQKAIQIALQVPPEHRGGLQRCTGEREQDRAGPVELLSPGQLADELQQKLPFCVCEHPFQLGRI